MSNLVNKLFADVNKFIAEKDLDLEFLIKFIDYILAEVSINIENEEEVQSYLQATLQINDLYKLLGLTTHMSDQQRYAYDNNTIIKLIEEPERLQKLKEFKLTIHSELNNDLISLFNLYRQGKF